MKFLAIAFLLVQSVHGLTTTRVECADNINDARAENAEQRQWGNMNKLLYNISLERTLSEFLNQYNGCPGPIHIGGSEYLVTLNIYEYIFRGEGGRLESEIEKGAFGMPTSTMMACALTTCLEDGSQIFSVITDAVKFSAIKGTPGSNCSSSGRLANSKGLCYLGSDQKKFVRKGVLQQVGDVIDNKLFGWG
ncbi:hypothetical protein GCK72_013110 [Caenorhabditis remanei]|uniref:Uncharacterized protein n=1 Tax=Caenorhabditis remanei TaxID=31234 RepID=A0A6A5GQ52_CAERE|nr:hypothetical protein GCK72_013110 [Caenorhabditis remanei]KAF1756656.1 hypothetical protein GCK72_013110 [Caenorhabditis remanei]